MTSNQHPDSETLKQWHNDPHHWIWGILYYNKNDKRIFPPKKTSPGWTINFANPTSVVALIAIIIVSGIFVYLFTGRFINR